MAGFGKASHIMIMHCYNTVDCSVIGTKSCPDANLIVLVVRYLVTIVLTQ